MYGSTPLLLRKDACTIYFSQLTHITSPRVQLNQPTPPPKASDAATPAPSGSAPARKLAANCSPSGSSAASGRSPGCRIRKSSMRSSTCVCSSSRVWSTELWQQRTGASGRGQHTGVGAGRGVPGFEALPLTTAPRAQRGARAACTARLPQEGGMDGGASHAPSRRAAPTRRAVFTKVLTVYLLMC